MSKGGSIRDVRGRDTPQIEVIAGYFLSRPNQVFSPAEVAEALDLNLNTVTTTINRLANEGTLVREERGKYKYPSSIDLELFERAYNSIYTIIKKSVGMQVTYEIMGLADKPFDPSSPAQSIQVLRNALSETFGEDTATHLITVTLRKEIGDKADAILREIGVI
ncbi:MAG: hypothetical protein AB1665_01305 [Candidatus Thermoplasmatota archaeon]